jgi:hypothetical protein
MLSKKLMPTKVVVMMMMVIVLKQNIPIKLKVWHHQTHCSYMIRITRVRNLGIFSFNLIQKISVIYLMTYMCMCV